MDIPPTLNSILIGSVHRPTSTCLPLRTPAKVGMVLDLTNSTRYYRFHDEFPDAEKQQLYYRKVRFNTAVPHAFHLIAKTRHSRLHDQFPPNRF